MRSLIGWIAVGLVGLVLAAGVSYAATQLSSQRIGLAAEPASAGEELAPPATSAPVRTTTEPTRTAAEPTRTAAEPREDRDDPAEEHEESEHGGDWDD